MSFLQNSTSSDSIEVLLDRLAADAAVQSNCAFQLALMMARITIEPCPETYKEESALVLMDLIRAKPRSNVVPLFGNGPATREAGIPRSTVA